MGCIVVAYSYSCTPGTGKYTLSLPEHNSPFFCSKVFCRKNTVTVMSLNSSPHPHTHSVWLWFPDDSGGECVLIAGRVLCASYKEEH